MADPNTLISNPNPPTPNPHSSLPTFTNLNTIKLTSKKFPIWKKQISSYLKANRLFSFVDGSSVCPPNESSSGFPDWQAKDNLVISIIHSSLSESAMVQVLECTTALGMWTRLHGHYSAQSGAQIVHTRLQLTTLKKGADSATAYCSKAKELVAAIQAAGQTVSDSELVVYLLAGLGPDYDSLVTSLSTQVTLPSSDQVLVYLMNFDSRLASQTSSIMGTPPANTQTTPRTPLEANFTTNRGRGNRGGFRGRGHGDYGRHPPQGRGRPSTFSGEPDSRSACQVCNKLGHTSLECWYRFDHAFQAPPPRSLQANHTTANWFPDTAATDHFTPDIGNFRLNQLPYQGTDQVTLGDGSTMPIRNHGFSDQDAPAYGPR